MKLTTIKEAQELLTTTKLYTIHRESKLSERVCNICDGAGEIYINKKGTFEGKRCPSDKCEGGKVHFYDRNSDIFAVIERNEVDSVHIMKDGINIVFHSNNIINADNVWLTQTEALDEIKLLESGAKEYVSYFKE